MVCLRTADPFPQVDVFTRWLLGILSAAFLLWAGVVWNTGASALRLVEQVEKDVTRLQLQIETHGKLDMHYGARLQFAKSDAAIDAATLQLQRIERLLNRIVENNSPLSSRKDTTP